MTYIKRKALTVKKKPRKYRLKIYSLLYFCDTQYELNSLNTIMSCNLSYKLLLTQKKKERKKKERKTNKKGALT